MNQEKNKTSVFGKLDAIEGKVISTDKKIDNLYLELESIKRHQNTTVQTYTKVSQENILDDFIKSSTKNYVRAGTKEEFSLAKTKVLLINLALIIIGIISTILSSIAANIYTTFSFFENIRLIFTFLTMLSVGFSKKWMKDDELATSSNEKYYQDKNGVYICSYSEKKARKVFRRIAHVCVFLNIISIWIFSKGGIAFFATIFEIAFFVLSILSSKFSTEYFWDYQYYIFFVGKNNKNESVIIVLDNILNQYWTYQDFKEKYKKMIDEGCF